MIDMTKFTVVRYEDETNGWDNLGTSGALTFSLDSPLAERTENHQALATGTSYNPHTSEQSEWLTKNKVMYISWKFNIQLVWALQNQDLDTQIKQRHCHIRSINLPFEALVEYGCIEPCMVKGLVI
ncbi:hypothetical protein Lal_00011043 [Lupinus albus]|nr:hypothetical protein Lal_00011043 [Lupinus albus]